MHHVFKQLSFLDYIVNKNTLNKQKQLTKY